jgi:hypothetical protein
MKASAFLRHADAILRDRRDSYGEPADFFDAVARRWSLALGVPITPRRVVLCLLEVKLQRLVRDPRHADSVADLAGYAAILSELER